MLRFGKYKGKTYEHVYKTDKGYCAWFVENCKQGKEFKKFILEKGLFNRSSIIGKRTTASELSKKISMDPEIRQFISELWETELNEMVEMVEIDDIQDIQDCSLYDYDCEPVELETPLKKIKYRNFANPKKNITPQLYGQFIDYFVRYRLSQKMGITFKDKAVSCIIKKQLKGSDIVSKAMEALNDYEEVDDTIDSEIFHNILRCASCHSIAFGEKKTKQTRVMLELEDEIVDRVDSFINIMLGFCSKPLQNPNISGKYISADADLIFKDTIVEIKTGKDDFVYYTVQLLIYAVLYKDLYEIDVKTLLIFNPCIEDHTITLSLKDGVLDTFTDYLKKLKIL